MARRRQNRIRDQSDAQVKKVGNLSVKIAGSLPEKADGKLTAK